MDNIVIFEFVYMYRTQKAAKTPSNRNIDCLNNFLTNNRMPQLSDVLELEPRASDLIHEDGIALEYCCARGRDGYWPFGGWISRSNRAEAS
jgi:hypothetical protein